MSNICPSHTIDWFDSWPPSRLDTSRAENIKELTATTYIFRNSRAVLIHKLQNSITGINRMKSPGRSHPVMLAVFACSPRGGFDRVICIELNLKTCPGPITRSKTRPFQSYSPVPSHLSVHFIVFDFITRQSGVTCLNIEPWPSAGPVGRVNSNTHFNYVAR